MISVALHIVGILFDLLDNFMLLVVLHCKSYSTTLQPAYGKQKLPSAATEKLHYYTYACEHLSCRNDVEGCWKSAVPFIIYSLLMNIKSKSTYYKIK